MKKELAKVFWALAGSSIVILFFVVTYPQYVKIEVCFSDTIPEENIYLYDSATDTEHNLTYYYLNKWYYILDFESVNNKQIVLRNIDEECQYNVKCSINNITLKPDSILESKKDDIRIVLIRNKLETTIKHLRYIHIILCLFSLTVFFVLFRALKKKSICLCADTFLHKIGKIVFGSFLLYLGFIKILAFSEHMETESNTFIVFLCLFLLTLYGITVFFLQKRYWKGKALQLIMVAITLIYSGYNMGNFLTVDENRSILEQVNLQDDILRHLLYFGNARSNYTIVGSIWKLIPPTLYADSSITNIQIAKVIHWYTGNIIILLISYFAVLLVQFNVKQVRKDIVFSATYIIILSNPLVLLALKNYNYDLYSMLFAVLSIEMLIYGIQTQRISWGICAISISVLAAQEKMTAIPVLLINVIITGFLFVGKKGHFCIRRGILYSIGSSIMIGTKLFANLFYISKVLRNNDFPAISLNDIYMPLIALYTQAKGTSGNPPPNGGWWAIILLSLTTFIAICVLSLFSSILKQKKTQIIMHLWDLRPRIFAICIITTLLLGILGTYLVPYTYMSGVYDEQSKVFIGNSVTAVSFHFDTDSYMENQLHFIVTMFAMIWNSIPSCIIILLLSVCWIYHKKDAGKKDNYILEFLFTIFSILAPLAYGIINLTPYNRYLNVYVLMVVLMALLLVWKHSRNMRKYKDALWYGICICCMIECLTFGPAYTSYWPFWNVMPYMEKENIPGRMLINWQGGWGEHIFMAGDKIQDYCIENNIPLENVNIYTNYHGSWLNNSNNLMIRRMPGYRSSSTAQYPPIDISRIKWNSETFFVFSKWGLRWASTEYSLPQDIAPIMVISYRGATECWIYTGEQLEDYFFQLSAETP